MSDLPDCITTQLRAFAKDVEERRRLKRLETERSLKELDDYIEHLQQRVVIAEEKYAKIKPLNYFENYPKRCTRIAIAVGLTGTMLFFGYMFGFRHGWDTGFYDGQQKGYRIVAHSSVQLPERWQKYVHDVTGK